MKARAILAIAALAASVATAPLAAQGVTGTWELSAEGRGGPQSMTLALVESGESLSGTITMAMGPPRGGGGGGGGRGAGGPGEAQTLEITDGSVSGSSFSFSVVLDRGGTSVTMHYSGAVDGDEMEGTVEGGRGGGRPFTGTRGS